MWRALTFSSANTEVTNQSIRPRPSSDTASTGCTTAVRSRKLDFADCENAHPKAGLTAVTVSLYGEKLTTKKVTATDSAIEACVKTKLDGVKIPNASPSDKLELEVELPPGT